MSPIDTDSISTKLIRLNEIILEFEDIRTTPEDLFLRDKRLQAVVERYFILGIEIIADIGNHLLVQKTSQAAESYRDIIKRLGETGLVPAEVAQRNEKMVSFRHVLVHVYGSVEPEQIYIYLQKAPEEFRAFAVAFAKYL